MNLIEGAMENRRFIAAGMTIAVLGRWNLRRCASCPDQRTCRRFEKRFPKTAFVPTSRRGTGTAAHHASGNLESETAARDREAGIPLSDTILVDIRKAAVELGTLVLLDM